MTPDQLELRVCSIDRFSTYVFTCPACHHVVTKPAEDPRVVRLLTSVGVRSTYWTMPAELDEPHDGPPLTSDDLIDLMLLLDQPDWALRLTASPSRR
jgi:hypothetical protein